MRALFLTSKNLGLPALVGKWSGILFVLITLSACTSTGSNSSVSDGPLSTEQLWIESIVAYKDQLPADHPDQQQYIFVISDEMRKEVQEQFGGMSKHGAAKAIAYWLLDEHGRKMTYDITANFSPIQAFEERRGNCLSFTMLLYALNKELGIEMEFNSVNIPDTWDMDDKLGMVFYRHVNGVVEAFGKKQIFDLAMDVYDAAYPQSYISETEVIAYLMNNRAIGHLEKDNIEQARHHLKLGISYDPRNPDLWVNLGVLEKRQGNFKKAEIAFLHAYSITKYSVVTVSNLERLYREQGMKSKAAMFAKQAERARQSNPYLHYNRALAFYEDGKYRKADRATNRAIILHNKDPRFFELKSLIAQQRGQYKKALKALERAYLASTGNEQRGKYAGKAELVTQNAISAYERQSRRDRRARVYKDVEIQPSSIFQ